MEVKDAWGKWECNETNCNDRYGIHTALVSYINLVALGAPVCIYCNEEMNFTGIIVIDNIEDKLNGS